MPLFSGYAYRIRNKYSQMFLSVSGCSTASMANIVQIPERRRSDDFLSSLTWYLYAIKNDHYIVINKGSGLLLNVVDSSEIGEVAAVQEELQITNTKSQIWFMLPSHGSTDDLPLIKIMNVNSRKYLTSAGTAPNTIVHQCDRFEYAPYSNVQLWEFIVDRNLSKVTDVNWFPVNSETVVKFIRMTSFNPPKAKESEKVLLGKLLLPFVLVRDTVFDRLQQTALSPFYQLHRFGFWKLIYFHHHTGIGEINDTFTIHNGVLTGNAETVRNILGISVCMERKFLLYDGISNLVGDKITRQLLIATDRGVGYDNCYEGRQKLYYPAGQRASYAYWARVDRYVLLRSDGTMILEWRNILGSTYKLDAFPSGLINVALGR